MDEMNKLCKVIALNIAFQGDVNLYSQVERTVVEWYWTALKLNLEHLHIKALSNHNAFLCMLELPTSSWLCSKSCRAEITERFASSINMQTFSFPYMELLSSKRGVNPVHLFVMHKIGAVLWGASTSLPYMTALSCGSIQQGVEQAQGNAFLRAWKCKQKTRHVIK